MRSLFIDVGNGWVKAVADDGQFFKFPHAIRPIDGAEADTLDMRGGNENPNIFKVDGRYWAIGTQAERSGASAVKYGQQRYTADYYGVIVAIAMFKLFEKSDSNVLVYGSHTPKDIVYRQDLIMSVKRPLAWLVEGLHDGKIVQRNYTVKTAYGAEEPVMAYRHAILDDTGMSYRGDAKLRKGVCLVIDCGTFTTAFTICENGIVDYESSRSEVYGAIDMLDSLENAIRRKYRTQLRNVNAITNDRLEHALMTGVYEAGMIGDLDVKDLADEVCYPHVNMILNQIDLYGGVGNLDSIMLAGGGGALQEKRIRGAINRAHIYMAEQNRSMIQFATAYGMKKTLATAVQSGRLKVG